MKEIALLIISGGIGAAIATEVMSILLYKIKRRDSMEDAQNNRCIMQTTAVRYLMLYIIRNECEKHIERGRITYDDRRMLHKWHDLYHDELGGNGDAKLLMTAVDGLPLELGGE